MPTIKHLASAKDGTPITDELVDELAREAEAGYDLTSARRVGRLSLAGAQHAAEKEQDDEATPLHGGSVA